MGFLCKVGRRSGWCQHEVCVAGAKGGRLHGNLFGAVEFSPVTSRSFYRPAACKGAVSRYRNWTGVVLRA